MFVALDGTRAWASKNPRARRFVAAKEATRILRDDPPEPATDARVTEFNTQYLVLADARMSEFYRQYLAVAVFVVAAFLMVGAMLGMAAILRPKVPQRDKY